MSLGSLDGINDRCTHLIKEAILTIFLKKIELHCCYLFNIISNEYISNYLMNCSFEERGMAIQKSRCCLELSSFGILCFHNSKEHKNCIDVRDPFFTFE